MRKLGVACLPILGLMLSVAISACSFKPTEGDAKRVIESSFKSELEQKLLKINKVTKTNAQDANYGGVQIYSMEVDAELEYLIDVAVCRQFYALRGETKIVPLAKYKSMKFWDKYAFESGCSTEIHKTGEKEIIKRLIQFVKKEKGWQAGEG